LPNDTYDELETFAKVLAISPEKPTSSRSRPALIDGAITGMLARSIRTALILTPDLYRDLEVETRWQFRRPRHRNHIKNGSLTVVSPIEDTPAYAQDSRPAIRSSRSTTISPRTCR